MRATNLGGEEKLSPIDVLRINKYYGCPVPEEEGVKVEVKEEEGQPEGENIVTTTTEAPETTEAVRTTMFVSFSILHSICCISSSTLRLLDRHSNPRLHKIVPETIMLPPFRLPSTCGAMTAQILTIFPTLR